MAKTSPSAHGTGLEPPRSDTLGDASDSKLPSDLTGVSAAATGSQKRGRGRPPKPKSSDSQLNGAVPDRKPSGRPRRNRAPTEAVPTSVVKRGRGRPKRSNTLSGTETVVDGSRKRGRPKKDDVAAPAKKRGRKPKSEVAKRSVGRPKKATEGGTGQGAADPKEIKKKSALLQKKVKQAAEKLKIAVSAIEEVQELAAGM
ncbi:putative DNA-binding protein At1g48610 [Brassica rapa]|uniref:putative DNA-binding protein At1g48610 n=1 Tax=Brassica campestris TaxID=3711 RepID=UPI0004F17DC5|nr:putative DNA-binding protein At1g48610 [Brassica rapa]